jgi:hypothetical protein
MIRMGVICALALGVSVVASPLAGGIILGVGTIVVLAYEAIRPAGLLRAAADSPHPQSGRRRVLVVANTALAGDDLADTVAGLAGPDAELDVLAPQLVSHARFVASDTDREARDAETRLKTSLDWAAAHGFDAGGEVGDDEPATAMADALGSFGADAVIIATNDRTAGWAEKEELERAMAELDVPVVHAVIRQ